jgi:ribosomal-protein-serine acetyltransferase
MLLPLRVDEALELRALTDMDANAVFDLLTQNRARLDSWLRWSGRVQTLDDTRALIQRFADKQAAGDGFHAGIWLEGRLVGGLVCHYINRDSRKTELGYWLSEDATGNGWVTRLPRCDNADDRR